MFRPQSTSALALSAAILSLVFARPARASSCEGTLVNSCINSDTLWPHAGPSRFLAVGGAETVAAGRVGFGLITSYQSRPIMLHVPSPGPSGTDVAAIDDQATGTFTFAYGVSRRLELDAMLPLTFGQSGSGASAITGANTLRDTATRDLRFGFAYALVERPRVDPRSDVSKVPAVLARLEMSAPVGDKDQFAGEKYAVFAPSVAADYRMGRLFFGAEAGARIRPTAELVGARVGTQAVIGVAAGFDVLARERLSVTLEARALPVLVAQATTTQTSAGLVSSPNDTYLIPAEWQLGVRSAPLAGGDLAIALAGGGWLPLSSEAAITTPRFRFTLGIVFAPLARDSDGDGVTDDRDKCPDQKGSTHSQAGAGCPESPQKTPEVIDATASLPAPPAASTEPRR